MGYLTNYYLSIKEGMSTTKVRCPICGGREEVIHDILELLYKKFELDEEIKWYEHETDMIEASKNYPDTTFRLYGEGEEQGDVWEKIFKNGKMLTTRKKKMVWEGE